jgi:quercetin 2,3-dioxygenase
MTNYVLHKAQSRGYVNHGWLISYHTFSFANYYNPERINFGMLRVLNDDQIAPGMGFGTHPHDNMEIISIPLEGKLEHKDSMGNGSVIEKNEIQVMSAGTGILHSEFNPDHKNWGNFLQIWVFPHTQNVTPRYDKIVLNSIDRKNKLQQIISPEKDSGGAWIHQNAWFYLGNFDDGEEFDYTIHHPENGIYFFVIDGTILINNQLLENRDGFGIWNIQSVHAKVNNASEILIMEVPMH